MVSRICCFGVLLFIAAIASSVATASTAFASDKIFDVRDYGARGDGKTDNTMAFTDAWKEACEWKGNPRVYVPLGTFYLGGITFMGPCQSPISFIINGTLLAPKDANAIKEDTWIISPGHTGLWIIFRYIDYLTVSGGGTLDGQGSYTWPLNNCHKTSHCRSFPMNIGFQFVRYSSIDHIKSINSKMGHIHFFSVSYFNVTQVNITAPEDSPNTDGIKIGFSNNINIHNVNIGTGDDCIAILSGTSDLDIYKVNCGPGHGISVGSLGKYKNEKSVHGLTVSDSVFNGTTDGVRIKTWGNSASQYIVTKFIYKNLQMINVENPINIDQNYCPTKNCGNKSASKIEIVDVKFDNIWGTSATKVAVNLQCSKSAPCKSVELIDVNLVHNGKDGPATAVCENVVGGTSGKISPPSCLQG